MATRSTDGLLRANDPREWKAPHAFDSSREASNEAAEGRLDFCFCVSCFFSDVGCEAAEAAVIEDSANSGGRSSLELAEELQRRRRRRRRDRRRRAAPS